MKAHGYCKPVGLFILCPVCVFRPAVRLFLLVDEVDEFLRVA